MCPTFWKAALEHFAARKFFLPCHPLSPNTISFLQACIVNILRYQRFYRVKDNFLWVLGWWSCASHMKQWLSFRAINCRVKDNFLWVLGWWSCASHMKQWLSFRAISCVDHKPLPLQLEFSKLKGAGDSFCLWLCSIRLNKRLIDRYQCPYWNLKLL